MGPATSGNSSHVHFVLNHICLNKPTDNNWLGMSLVSNLPVTLIVTTLPLLNQLLATVAIRNSEKFLRLHMVS